MSKKTAEPEVKTWLKSHPVEGDGAITGLFNYLWKKNKELESCPLVRIPDTVVYEHNFPRGWFLYDAKNSELRKKAGKELETNAIYKEFSRMVSPNCEIVACYLSKVGDAESGTEVTSVEFMDKDDLHKFFFKREKREQGILQRFVMPKGGLENSVIQAIWSPHVTLVERRNNVHKLNDKRFSMYERAVTYEGPAHHSADVFCAPQLVQQVKDICNAIVNHFWSTEHKNITRMVLYFKVDNNNNVWLLWSSSIRVADKYQMTKTVPLNLFPQFYSPEDSRSVERVPAAILQAKENSKKGEADSMMDGFHCPNCNDKVEGERFELPLEKIIAYFAHQAATAARPASRSSLSASSSFFATSPSRVGSPSTGKPPRPRTLVSSTMASSSTRLSPTDDFEELRLDAMSSSQSEFGAAGSSMRHGSPSAFEPLPDDELTLPPIPGGRVSIAATGGGNPVVESSGAESAEAVSKRQQIHNFINSRLDDLVYEAYSHFLHASKPFVFTLPQAVFDLRERLMGAFARFGVTQVGDTQSFSISNANSSVGKLQRDFQELKEVIRTILNEEANPASRITTPRSRLLDETEGSAQTLEALRAQRRSESRNSMRSPGPETPSKSDHVPPLVRKFLPDISNEEFTRIMEEPIFLSRNVELCETCFLLFTERPSISGSLIRVDPWQKVSRSGRPASRSGMAATDARSMSPSSQYRSLHSSMRSNSASPSAEFRPTSSMGFKSSQ